ncbi:MAG TPA: hypothetical protein VJ853_06965 [Thermoanaerobaculia bacterium]|nr:hypothetical protein [Thermoanaerobaculia bacterium]
MSRPELIVPIRDRRRHRRILTLKNFGRAFVAAAVLFVGLTVYSDFHHPQRSANYGRLFGKQVSSQTAIASPKYDVVKEAPVNDETAADPTLVDAQRREQWLSIETPAPTTTADPQTSTANPITITQTTPQQSRPLLSGGIFRQ